MTMTNAEKINIYQVLIDNSISESKEYLLSLNNSPETSKKIQHILQRLDSVDHYLNGIKKLTN